MSSILPAARQQYLGPFTLPDGSVTWTPLVGGRIYTYDASTNTPKQTYADADGVVPNANPIVLDARGEATVFWNGSYKVKLCDALDNEVWTVNGVASSDAVVASLAAQIAGITATVANGFTVIAGDGMTDRSADIATATAAGKPILFTGQVVVGTPVTITVSIIDTQQKIFADGAQVTIANGEPVCPEWFGMTDGNIMRAVNALPATGGPIKFGDKRYPPSYTTATPAMLANGTGTPGVDYLAKPGVSFICGAGRPLVAAGRNRLTDGTGTIIEGPFYVSADAFTVVGTFGVDSGPDVCAARYSNTARDAFAHVQTNKASPVYRRGGDFGNIVGLGLSPTSLVHGVLIEGVDTFRVGHAYGVNSVHGAVVKGRNGVIDTLQGSYNDLENTLIQSDSYAQSSNLVIGKCVGDNNGSTSGAACQITAQGNGMSGISIGQVFANIGRVALAWGGAAGMITSGCIVGSVIAYGHAYGMRRVNDTRACSVTRMQVNNASVAVIDDASGITAFPFVIQSVTALNCQDIISTSGAIRIVQLDSVATAGNEVFYQTTTARVYIVNSSRANPTAAKFGSAFPDLLTANGWSNASGFGSFFVDLQQGGVAFHGNVNAGTAGTPICNLTAQLRPVVAVLFAIAGRTAGGVPVAGQLRCDTNGDVSIPNQPTAATWNLEGVVIPGIYV